MTTLFMFSYLENKVLMLTSCPLEIPVYFSEMNILGGEEHLCPTAKNLGIDNGIAEVEADNFSIRHQFRILNHTVLRLICQVSTLHVVSMTKKSHKCGN